MKARKDIVYMGTKLGAVLGGIAFLIFGIVPGFYFGSYGTLVLLSRLIGGPLEATVLIRVLTAIGIILGIFCIGAVSIVVGSIFGTVVGYATEAIGNLAKAKKEIPAEAETEAAKTK